MIVSTPTLPEATLLNVAMPLGSKVIVPPAIGAELLENVTVPVGMVLSDEVTWAVIAPGDRTRGEALSEEGRRSVVIILGLMLCFVVAGLIGPIVVLLIDRRLPAIKVVFNIAQFTLATCLAVIVFRAGLAGMPAPPDW